MLEAWSTRCSGELSQDLGTKSPNGFGDRLGLKTTSTVDDLLLSKNSKGAEEDAHPTRGHQVVTVTWQGSRRNFCESL
jgi:hypothetical protein